MGIEFEYTAPGTPQESDHVEQKFATLFNGHMPCLTVGSFLPF